MQPDETVLATVSRGKYKNTQQVMSLLQLQTLTGEVDKMITIIEPILAKHGVIEGTGQITRAEER